MRALSDLSQLELLILHRAMQDVSVQSMTDHGYTLREATDARAALRTLVWETLTTSQASPCPECLALVPTPAPSDAEPAVEGDARCANCGSWLYFYADHLTQNSKA